MIYKDFHGSNLSALGMGAMRLPIRNGNYADIDEGETKKMVDYAMARGLNYYDTAWGYHEGQSEVVLGKALKPYPRDSFFLANKFPGYDLANMDKVRDIFEEQLKRCQVEYFDFYMFHNVCEMNIDAYLDEKYGILSYLLEQKKAGRIRHLGFSAHGSQAVMKRFLEAYGSEMEFCLLQLNYLDWSFQNAKAKIDLLHDYQLPVMVMEPLRGGQLASLSAEHTATLKALRPEEPIPAWAFRFLQSIPNVITILSGVSNFAQLSENLQTFETEKPLSIQESAALFSIAEEIIKKTALPCTSCRYCEEHCPQKLEISNLLSLYNEHLSTQAGFIAPMAMMAIPEEKRPGACTACESCEAVCPQQIKVSVALADFTEKLSG